MDVDASERRKIKIYAGKKKKKGAMKIFFPNILYPIRMLCAENFYLQIIRL